MHLRSAPAHPSSSRVSRRIPRLRSATDEHESLASMELKYARTRIFFALKDPFSRRVRRERMKSFATIMDLKDGMSIIDLGGSPAIWEGIGKRLNLTVLNLPGSLKPVIRTSHNITYVEGDACDVKEFADRSFQIAFSNSVIEHVGSKEKRSNFAKEVRRLGSSYWVQTPAIWFPIEPHCGMPFWWFYPASLKRYFINRWRKKLPEWTSMVEGTSILLKGELRRLFPEATICTEKVVGIPKSYIVYFAARDH